MPLRYIKKEKGGKENNLLWKLKLHSLQLPSSLEEWKDTNYF